METKISATELANKTQEILDRVRDHGESFKVEQDGKVVAEIKPAGSSRFTVADFIEMMRSAPATDDKFADDLEKIHASQGPLPPSPWDC